MARDPYEYFRIEARDLLDQLGKGVLRLEKGPALASHVALLLRLAHTLKGAARVVKQREIAELSHAIEDALEPLRDGGMPVGREAIERLLAMLDAASSFTARLAVPGAEPSTNGAAPPPSKLAVSPKTSAPRSSVAPSRLSSAPAAAATEGTHWGPRAEAQEMAELVDGIAEVGTKLVAIRRVEEALRRAGQLADVLASRGLGTRAGAGPAERASEGAIGEELRTLLTTAERELHGGVEQAERELHQAREAAERLQLLPVGLMFHTLERAVRDAAVLAGKNVAFEASGGSTRVDADVLGVVQAALLHAVRNAVAHGIEDEAQRRARDKAPQGRVTLTVKRSGHRVAFVCRDDGRGLDLEAVSRAARRSRAGRVEGPELGESELVDLLLKGGISTAKGVDEVSGRGVGLDVVRESALRLGGEVTLQTDEGRGMTLAITVPVRTSTLDVLFAEVADEPVALPLDAVKGTLRLGPKELEQAASAGALAHDGEMLPFLSMASILALSPSATAGGASAVVIESDGTKAVAAADRLLGIRSVVLRPLPDLLPAQRLAMGVAFDASGRPLWVLDPHGIVATRATRLVSAAPVERPPILVIDDSLTTRMLEQSILESAGYPVDVATSGEEGMERALQRPYGLFLVDVEMPGMDGFTFVERTRADPALQRVPAILVTSRSSVEDRRRGESAGASAYVVKGEFDQRALLAKIQELVG